MDIRTEKTKKAIKNAFLELRSKKSLERITVKELCGLAQINKSTFYSHYDDIYALSDALQTETVAYILSTISHAQAYSSENPDIFTRELFTAIIAHKSLIEILFSGKDQSYLIDRLEEGIKELVYRKYPEYRDDLEKDILLTYSIHGGYHAYLNHPDTDEHEMLRIIENIVKQLQPLY